MLNFKYQIDFNFRFSIVIQSPFAKLLIKTYLLLTDIESYRVTINKKIN